MRIFHGTLDIIAFFAYEKLLLIRLDNGLVNVDSAYNFVVK